MELLTPSIREALVRNGWLRLRIAADGKADVNFYPVVKLFTPDAACTWLLTELDPEEPDIAFGLCDLGMGCPELGIVSISELESVRGKLGLPVERDLCFVARDTLAVYARAAWNESAITEREDKLREAAEELAAERSAS